MKCSQFFFSVLFKFEYVNEIELKMDVCMNESQTKHLFAFCNECTLWQSILFIFFSHMQLNTQRKNVIYFYFHFESFQLNFYFVWFLKNVDQSECMEKILLKGVRQRYWVILKIISLFGIYDHTRSSIR